MPCQGIARNFVIKHVTKSDKDATKSMQKNVAKNLLPGVNGHLLPGVNFTPEPGE